MLLTWYHYLVNCKEFSIKNYLCELRRKNVIDSY